jgi:MerR family transcriptional regulator, light-induced transcriptional regulator
MASTWGMEDLRPHPGQAGRTERRETERSPEMLAKLIEVEIIPRLLLAHGCDPMRPPMAELLPQAVVGPNEAHDFASLALDNEAHILMRHVDEALTRGLAIETILVEILAPAARDLGIRWENDEADFVDVTMGLWRLQELVYELSARAPGAAGNRGGDRRAFFCVFPGEQHSLGTVIVDECFRRRGWDTRCVTNATERQLLTLVGERWFEIIGLTASCEHHIDELTRLIGSLRDASRNPSAGIMVGGQIFNKNPDLALRIGADGTAQDARQAVDCAEALVARMASSPAAEA